MKEGYNPKSEKRSILLRLMREKDIPLDTAREMVEPMRGMPEEEKERIAEHLILNLLSQTGDN